MGEKRNLVCFLEVLEIYSLSPLTHLLSPISELSANCFTHSVEGFCLYLMGDSWWEFLPYCGFSLLDKISYINDLKDGRFILAQDSHLWSVSWVCSEAQHHGGKL